MKTSDQQQIEEAKKLQLKCCCIMHMVHIMAFPERQDGDTLSHIQEILCFPFWALQYLETES